MARLSYIHFADLMLEIKERSLTDMAAYGIVIASKLSLSPAVCQAAYCTNLKG